MHGIYGSYETVKLHYYANYVQAQLNQYTIFSLEKARNSKLWFM